MMRQQRRRRSTQIAFRNDAIFFIFLCCCCRLTNALLRLYQQKLNFSRRLVGRSFDEIFAACTRLNSIADNNDDDDELLSFGSAEYTKFVRCALLCLSNEFYTGFCAV